MLRKTFLNATTAALLGAAALTMPAQATEIVKINFEGASGLVGGDDFIQQNGMTIGFYDPYGASGSFVGLFADGTDPQSCFAGACPVNNASTYYAALNDSYVDITNSNNFSFRVNSFDASFIGGSSVLSSYPALPGFLRIQGFFASGGSAYEDYALYAPGPGGFEFGSYNTSAAFAKNMFVEVAIFGFACNAVGSCNAFTTDRGQFALDNISLTVPEPSTQMMFGLGLLAMLTSVRRRQA